MNVSEAAVVDVRLQSSPKMSKPLLDGMEAPGGTDLIESTQCMC
jgi:hypothetical protein